MTVGENLEMGAVVPRARRGAAAALARILDLFPRLRERFRQRAGTLSGGEQQMLAIARCLMGQPRLIMLDEPSLGLAPIVVEDVFAAVRELNSRDRLTIMLVEQNVVQSLGLADRGYVLENGRVVMSGSGRQLLADDGVRRAYVGI
jgi:branched-chain amino acid transport system ATP-binding protein